MFEATARANKQTQRDEKGINNKHVTKMRLKMGEDSEHIYMTLRNIDLFFTPLNI